MTNTKSKEEENDGLNCAKGTFEHIKEMMGRYSIAVIDQNDKKAEEIRQEIEESHYGIQVRSGWYSPGSEASDVSREPHGYLITMAGGGPAARIIGELGDHNEPIAARIEHLDWGKPWTEYSLNSDDTAILLDYAGMHWYGE